jgi:hypothetical protein
VDRFPTDLLLYGAVFLMILLFNYLARQRARQQVPPAQDPAQNEALASDAHREQDEPPSEFWGRVDSTRAAPPIVPESVAHFEQPRSRGPVFQRAKRYDRQSLFGSKHDVRKAIVLMTVLGPCRGAAPPGGGAAL